MTTTLPYESNSRPTLLRRWLLPVLALLAMSAVATVYVRTRAQPEGPPPSALAPIVVDAVPVPLDAHDQAVTSVGSFRYAGGLALTSKQTELLHELSDITIDANNRFAVVGDAGVLFEGRLVLDGNGRLTGVADTTLGPLRGRDGRPLEGDAADAEGLTRMPNGDRLVSFEQHQRIWLYPGDGGPPRAVPSPPVTVTANAGLEALTATPDVAPDSYIVGAEETGETWTCRLTMPCVKGPTVAKPKEFGLVAANRFGDGLTAYLLRAYDVIHGNRITLEILRDSTVVARMDMARPLTVDNLEGMTSVPGPRGGRRFYLISDDNKRATQRTLLMAFDWQPAAGVDVGPKQIAE